MKRLFVAAFILAITGAVAANAGDLPRGVYAMVEADDSAGCARICAEDTLCASWSFQSSNNSCALRATQPAGPPPVTLAAVMAPAAAAAPSPPPQPAPPLQAEETQDGGLLGGPESAESSAATPQPLADLRSR